MIENIRIPTPAGTFDALACGEQDGRAVLLLHGFPEAAAEWEFQLRALGGGGCRAVAPDQRGYSPGVRPEHVTDYQVSELVGDVAAIADELGWQRFDLVGHDWGAIVAWATAAALPERVRSLTAVSVPHPVAFTTARAEDEDQAERSRYISVFRQTGAAERRLLEDDARALRGIYQWKVPEERVEDYVRRFSEPGALTAALNWYRAMDLMPEVAPVSVPTLFVWSTEDAAIGSAGALATEKHVTGPYRFEIMDEVSHWIPEEAPEQLTRMIMEHLLAHRV
ncbi:alpha/beta hydrolase [Kutzneria viridogrisea]|uniref:Haloalkane dehalogenase n=2 Tax=Kutzneria TaxID=43356 RepID=W5W7N9_9PSEU|nr:alpha/beta hydrolase [Kutzneria albida]AHH97138.1 haloalkane dehalogenase [Kutzneria albida DSM 43870]MBA8931891.1 pimeloyl-ACP methyl ester carboxylesterase [Kutzneria viridogrisea]